MTAKRRSYRARSGASSRRKTAGPRLNFGTAGLPRIAKGAGPLAGIEALAELGLDAMELEFVRGVWMDTDLAREVKRRARALKIHLTAHAPYWLNLNSSNPTVVRASKNRIIESATAADAAGAKHLALHAAFYSGDSPDRAYRNVRRRLKQLSKRIIELGLKISLNPELMGRSSQFGSIEEILSLCSEIPRVFPCIDFAHHHARTRASNTYGDYCRLLDLVRESLGSRALKRMHIHVAGIEYGPKGERRHLNLTDSDMDFGALMAALKDKRVGGIVICESPDIENDALLLKRTYLDTP